MRIGKHVRLQNLGGLPAKLIMPLSRFIVALFDPLYQGGIHDQKTRNPKQENEELQFKNDAGEIS